VACLLVLEVGQRLQPRLPAGLVVVVAAVGACQLLGLAGRGVPLVGPVPEGLPRFALPAVNFQDVRQLIPLALACFVLAYLEGMATARACAADTDDKIEANQELVALGVANAVLGLGQGYPAGGGLSRDGWHCC
jgi:MFS superfamily sulfate permease-like transporter